MSCPVAYELSRKIVKTYFIMNKTKTRGYEENTKILTELILRVR